jgi:hypothetical protein
VVLTQTMTDLASFYHFNAAAKSDSI